MLFLLALCAIYSGCDPAAKRQSPPQSPNSEKTKEAASLEAEKEEAVSDRRSATEAGLPWAEVTFSPRPGSSPDPELAGLEEVCGQGEQALHEVATLLATAEAGDGTPPSPEEASFHMRRRGTPYVHPRLWSARMNSWQEELVREHVEAWAKARSFEGQLRCGVGMATTSEQELIVSVLQVDALAEVAPFPTQVESGTRLSFRARLLEPATAASLLLLPPKGRPFSVETELSGDQLSGTLFIDAPGTWLVQLMATMSGGPRPVAGALVTADDLPPDGPNKAPVPGEMQFTDSSPADQLFLMLNAAREEEGLPALARNRVLDELALRHSRAMRDQDRLGHDTGRGSPKERVERAGLGPKAVGENVARAGSVVALHRALWASPSHRENLLLRRWDQVGVAVLGSSRRPADMFATQLFADDDR